MLRQQPHREQHPEHTAIAQGFLGGQPAKRRQTDDQRDPQRRERAGAAHLTPSA